MADHSRSGRGSISIGVESEVHWRILSLDSRRPVFLDGYLVYKPARQRGKSRDHATHSNHISIRAKTDIRQRQSALSDCCVEAVEYFSTEGELSKLLLKHRLLSHQNKFQ